MQGEFQTLRERGSGVGGLAHDIAASLGVNSEDWDGIAQNGAFNWLVNFRGSSD